MPETTRSEKVKNYFVGIGAMTGLILGLMAQFRGEPVAEKTWNTLRDQVNKQTELINDLYTQLEVMKAVQEARSVLELEHEIEALRKKYEEPKATGKARKSSSRKPASAGPEAQIKKLEEKLLQQEMFARDFAESDIPEQRMLETLPQSLEEASK